MLQNLLDPIFAPFRLLRSKIFQAQQLPARVKGEIGRVTSEASSIRSEAQGYAGSAKGAAQKAGNLKAPKKRMGLFSSKVPCPGCGQKLHPSWDECPYCGWKKGAPQAAASGGGVAAAAGSPGANPNRTMALDVGAAPQAGSGTMLGWFIPLEGERIGELIELRGRMTVGKGPNNHIVIVDPSISTQHAEFVGSASGFKLNDLASTNGTFVNDKRVQTHELIDNDEVKLGKVRFKYKSLG